MRITSSGNVGIGTTNPGQKLEVNGWISTLAISGGYERGFRSGTSGAMTFQGTIDNNWNGTIFHNAYADGNGNYKWISTHAAFGSRGIKFDYASPGGIIFYADSAATTANTTFTPTPRMIIRNNGTIGIGTLYPASNLAISGNVVIGSGYATSSGPTDGLAIQGNVGIGTTNPLEKLDVSGNATVSGNLTLAGGARTIASRSMNSLTIGDSQTGNIQFYSSSNYINSSGNLVLAGTLSAAGSKFQVDSNGDIVKLKNLTYSWPSSHVTNGFLKNDGSGNLTWETISVSSLKWNALTDPDGNLTLNHSTYTTTFNSSATTGTFFTINANSLTSGTGLYLTSTSTGLTGDLVKIEASGNNAAVTGNVLKVGLTGASATGTALNVTTAGSSGFALRVNDDGTYTDSTPFVVDSSGNVGIGTTSPTAKLDIAGDASTSGSLVLRGTSPATLDILNGSRFDIQTSVGGDEGLTPRLTITNDGKAGIGTTSPQAPLEVISAPDVTSIKADFEIRAQNPYNRNQYAYFNFDYTNNRSRWGTWQTGVGPLPTMIESTTIYLNNSTDNVLYNGQLTLTGEGRFNGSGNSWFLGNVGVGTTAPSQKLHIAGNMRLTGALYDVNNEAGTAGQVLSSTGSGVDWIDIGGTHTHTFTLAGSSGTPQTITVSGDTLTIAAGTNITTTAGATDTVTVATVANPTFSTSVTSPLFRNDGNITIDAYNNTADSSITLYNSSASYVANINLSDGSLQTGGTTRLTNAGVLQNITGYTQSSGAFSFSGGGNFSVDSSAFDVTTAGAVSGVTTLSMSNQLTNSYANTGAITLSGNGAGITFTGTGPNQIITASGVNLALMPGGTGNVGVGTTAPSQKLHIAGNMRLTGALYDVNNEAGTAGQVLSSTGSGVDWIDIGGTHTHTFTLAGSSGTPQTITVSGDTLTIAAGTNITTTAGATDTVTVATVANPTFSTSVTSPLFRNDGNITIDAYNNTADSSITLYNSSASYVANINLSDGSLQTGGTTRLTNAGVLQNITGYTQSSGAFSFSGGGNFSVDSSAFDVTTAGAVSGVTTLSMSNQLTNSYANTGAITLSGNGAGITFTGTGPNQIITASGVNLALMPGGTGNVGIGTTSPQAKLDVNGDIIGNGKIKVGYLTDYTNENYGIDPAGSTNFGGYSLKITGGALLAVDSGNVGIGTTLPTEKLEVKGKIRLSSSNAQIFIDDNTAANKIVMNNNGPTYYMGISSYAVGSDSALGLGYTTSPTTKVTDAMTILSSGNVGIGTTSPSSKLDVAGTAWLRGAAADQGLYVDSFGNVGIGTTNPFDTLDVNGRINQSWNYLFEDFWGPVSTGGYLENGGYAFRQFYFHSTGTSRTSPYCRLDQQTTDPNINGVMSFNSRGAATICRFSFNGRNAFNVSNYPVFEINAYLYSTGGTQVIYIGLSDRSGTTTGAPKNGIYFLYNPASYTYWRAITRATGTQTNNNTKVAPSTTAFQKLRFNVTPSAVYFYINDSLVATNTTNIPTRNLELDISLFSDATTRYLYMDYLKIWQDWPVNGSILSSKNTNENTNNTSIDYTQNADIAEVYNVENPSDFDIGNLVSVDPSKTGYVNPSEKENDPNLIGVVSASPEVILGANAGKDLPYTRVALLGRVKTKIVTSENEKIEVGDPITSSEIKGFGKKSKKEGKIIGYALEKFDPTIDFEKMITCPSQSSNKKCGLILVNINPQWYNPPSLALDNFENLLIQPASISSTLETFSFELKELTGEIIKKIDFYSDLLVANLKGGAAQFEQLFSKLIKGEKGEINQLISQEIISPVVETEQINFQNQNAKIKTQNDNAKLKIVDKNDQPIAEFKTDEKETSLFGVLEVNSNQEKGKLAQVILKNLEGKSTVVIDASGNASFSGQLAADSLKIENNATISGSLAAKEASVEGKLIAKEVEAENINEITRQLENSQTDINEIQKLLADIKNQPLPDLTNQTNLSNTTDFNQLQPILTDLTVTNLANIYTLSVTNSATIGNLLIENDKILSLSWELKLSSLSTINFFDGAVVIAKDGTITTKGTLIAEGGIKTDTIAPQSGENLNILGNLSVLGSLSLPKATDSAVIAAPENFLKNGIFAPAMETATASAGIGILPQGQNEVIIYNDNVRENSLIYLTPTTSTSTQLSVIEKKSCHLPTRQSESLSTENCKPYFKVVSTTPENKDVKFDWLIIN
jgi:hypothetical protein